MRTSRCSVLLIALLVTTSSSGCGLFSQSTSATVLVRDAETQQPIPDATVKVSYFTLLMSYNPGNSVVKTGRDGTARVQITTSHPMWDIRASAPAYTGSGLPEDMKQFEEPAGLQKPVVIEMYAKPGHVLELVVPDGYRGLVYLEQIPTDAAQLERGKRILPAIVSPAGVARVKWPRVLMHTSTDIRPRFANGTMIQGEPRKDVVGFQDLRISTDKGGFYFIGKQQDLDRSEDHFFYKRDGSEKPTLDEAAVAAWIKSHE